MFRTSPRRMALLGVLVAVAGCTTLQQSPLGTTGTLTTGTTGSASSSIAVAPVQAPKVAKLNLMPEAIELNAPYSYGGYQSETEAGLSEREAAGYPTNAKLSLTFLDSEGKRTLPAEIDWHSSNPALVAVDSTGWIRSVDPGTSGTATIHARLKSDPTIEATASVLIRNDGKLSLELK